MLLFLIMCVDISLMCFITQAVGSRVGCRVVRKSDATLASVRMCLYYICRSLASLVIPPELIGNPSILFLDEPTSGLDAFQAFNVMQSLWSLAQAGRTVLATVHQPRSSIFQMFDLLMLITQGQMVYFGAASDAVGVGMMLCIMLGGVDCHAMVWW